MTPSATRSSVESATRELKDLLGSRASDAAAVRDHHSHGESYHVHAPPDIVCFPQTTEEVTAIVRIAAAHRLPVVPFGAGTSLEGHVNAVHGGVTIDLREMNRIVRIGEDDLDATVEAGVTRLQLYKALKNTGLTFPVDPGADATLGGMAATRASGTTAVRYGTMRENVLGLTVVLADGGVIKTGTRARKSSAGYDLTRLFVGSEGTLGVITEVDVRLHAVPAHRITAVAGFADLSDAVAAGRVFRDIDGIAALELIDARALELTAQHLDVVSPVDAAWLLLIEMAGDQDQSERLADALADAPLSGEPAVGTDAVAQQRLWRLREGIAEVLGIYGPPLKFDVSLPLPAIPAFAGQSADLVAGHAPDATPVLFGHVGEGNLHLNVLRCNITGDREHALYSAMMDLIAACGGNVSSEHGVGSRKRDYVGMSREPADITLMRTIKSALDPTGYLNAAVLFD